MVMCSVEHTGKLDKISPIIGLPRSPLYVAVTYRKSSKRSSWKTMAYVGPSSATYRCISCLAPAPAILKTTDGTFIKLLECCACGQIIDRYVECEKSIIFMDMMLQEITVYRHILYNADNFTPQFYMKLAVSLVLSEGYIRWTNFAHNLSAGNGIKNNEVYLYIMCLLTAIEIGIFGIIITVYSWIKLSYRTWSSIYNGLLLGQCGRLANIAAIIWYQGSSITFQGLVLIFIFISSIQSTRAALRIGKAESTLLVFTAFICSLYLSYILQPLIIRRSPYLGGRLPVLKYTHICKAEKSKPRTCDNSLLLTLCK
ncbi:protein ARV1 isoform X3 [Cherax quadricarinatus]|uniref:protein ARV1 isoform X3 n=1 Tax=Cherax quadricarinatus TaxID=27406 RepID=UPI0023789CDF|nr:protein ARV1-like isoform X2 [Cherax quadricarinatus]